MDVDSPNGTNTPILVVSGQRVDWPGGNVVGS